MEQTGWFKAAIFVCLFAFFSGRGSSCWPMIFSESTCFFSLWCLCPRFSTASSSLVTFESISTTCSFPACSAICFSGICMFPAPTVSTSASINTSVLSCFSVILTYEHSPVCVHFCSSICTHYHRKVHTTSLQKKYEDVFSELNFKPKGHSPAYNHTLAKILVEYASAVYMSDLTELFTWSCSRCNDLTEGFKMIELIVDVQHCLQAYVGVAQDPNAIIIVFRGTQEHSIQNWIEDLYWKQLDLNYPGMPDSMVHHGFYSAYHNTTIRPGILNAIERAKEFYGELKIMVTGHSMGGAMAAFCGLDLVVNCEVQDVQVMTFGQPRIGNSAFASFYSEKVPNTVRVTHEHDMVPHLPPYYSYFPQKTYHHFPREVWLYNVGLASLVYGVEKVCDGSGEDPSCSRSVMGNSISDHLVYYGVELQAKTWSSCRIVMEVDPSVPQNSKTDQRGNIVLSVDSDLLRLGSGSDSG